MRLPQVVSNLIAVAGLAVLGAPSRPARACSCTTGYARSDVAPASGSVGTHPHSSVHFSIGGFAALTTEDSLAKGYVLLQERPRRRLALRHHRVGSFVRLTPTQPLSPRTWYRVEAPGRRGKGTTLLTRFQTGQDSPLRRLPRTRLAITGGGVKVSSGHGRGMCYASPSVTVSVPAVPILPVAQTVYHWEVEQQVGQRWVPIEGSPVLEKRVVWWRWEDFVQCLRRRNRRRATSGAPCHEPQPRLMPLTSIRVRNSQCSQGPSVGSGLQSLRLALVRNDGQRRTGPTWQVFVPR